MSIVLRLEKKMTSSRFFQITIITCFLLLNSCSPKYGIQLQNGDLLFVSADDGQLSDAIDRVTQTTKSTHYSHVALLEKSGKDCWVLQADTRNGSERIPLSKFLQYTKDDKNSIDVYRLSPAFQQTIPNAVQAAKTMLGKPYNYTYILSDTAFYCSDFVQRAFARDTVFSLAPMSFKDSTGNTNKVWFDFYQKQHLAVPEGKPGCNPNGLANSDKIRFVGIILRGKI